MITQGSLLSERGPSAGPQPVPGGVSSDGTQFFNTCHNRLAV